MRAQTAKFSTVRRNLLLLHIFNLKQTRARRACAHPDREGPLLTLIGRRLLALPVRPGKGQKHHCGGGQAHGLHVEVRVVVAQGQETTTGGLLLRKQLHNGSKARVVRVRPAGAGWPFRIHRIGTGHNFISIFLLAIFFFFFFFPKELSSCS